MTEADIVITGFLIGVALYCSYRIGRYNAENQYFEHFQRGFRQGFSIARNINALDRRWCTHGVHVGDHCTDCPNEIAIPMQSKKVIL